LKSQGTIDAGVIGGRVISRNLKLRGYGQLFLEGGGCVNMLEVQIDIKKH